MAGRYFTDDSKLGAWYVPDGQTPAQALAQLSIAGKFYPDENLVTKPDYTGLDRTVVTTGGPFDVPPGGPVDTFEPPPPYVLPGPQSPGFFGTYNDVVR